MDPTAFSLRPVEFLKASLRESTSRSRLKVHGIQTALAVANYALVAPMVRYSIEGTAAWLTTSQYILTVAATTAASFLPANVFRPLGEYFKANEKEWKHKGWKVLFGAELVYVVLFWETLACIFSWDLSKTFVNAISQGLSRGFPVNVISLRWKDEENAAYARGIATFLMGCNKCVVNSLYSRDGSDMPAWVTFAEVTAFNLLMGGVLLGISSLSKQSKPKV